MQPRRHARDQFRLIRRGVIAPSPEPTVVVPFQRGRIFSAFDPRGSGRPPVRGLPILTIAPQRPRR